MKRKKTNFTKKNKKKKQGKALTITLLISGVIMTGLLAWLGMNDWNVGKSVKNAQEIISMPTPVKDDDRKTLEVPEEETELIKEQGDKSEQESVEQTPSNPAENDNTETNTEAKPTPSIDNGGYIEGQQLPEKPTYVKGILIANKKYPLPKTYAIGEDKEARAAFEKMAAEAKLSQFNLTAFSTYRSFDYQTTLYDRYVARDGKEAADTYSARPGYSEHQTGLAFDIGEVNFEQYFASSAFGETEAGKWVAQNAHRFGFIMRYPAGKEQVTGYMHESWHFRYVGTDIATEIYNRKITLEEYLGI